MVIIKMSDDFGERILLSPQIKIDKILQTMEFETRDLDIDDKIYYFYQKLISEEFETEHLTWAKRFCKKKIKQLKRQRLLIRNPRHIMPKRVQKGRNIN